MVGAPLNNATRVRHLSLSLLSSTTSCSNNTTKSCNSNNTITCRIPPLKLTATTLLKVAATTTPLKLTATTLLKVAATTTPLKLTATTSAITRTAEMELGQGEVVMMEENQLQPFQHQVAGHSLMFRNGSGTICKALTPRELEVYQNMPEILKRHIPKFKGVVAVNINDLNKEGEDCKDDPEAKRRKAKLPSILRRLNKITHYAGNTYQFLLMENIVENYQRPCLLDLKLGIKPSISKRPNKTSDTLGLALCGMKVYQSRTGQHVHLDKEAGRDMDEAVFHQTVRHFLFNGHHLQRDLIPPILQQLQQLKTAISQLPTYRFYSSSLLIVYDADDEHADTLQPPSTPGQTKLVHPYPV